jgi:hypothetical protein
VTTFSNDGRDQQEDLAVIRDRIRARVVGRERELDLVLAAVDLDRTVEQLAEHPVPEDE